VSLLRQLLIILVLSVGAAGAWWYYSNAAAGPAAPGRTGGPDPRGVTVEVAEARRGLIAEDIEAVGTLLASRSIEVTAKSSGQIEAILFEPGQRVAQGDVLVRLDSTIEAAKLDEARAQLANARSQLERARQLLGNRTIAQARVDDLEAAFAAARARAAAAEQRLRDRVVHAPYAGVVGFREVDTGARVTDDTVLTRLDDIAVVELEVRIPEVFYGLVRRGQPVGATAAAFPGETFRGAVAAIDTRIDPVARSFRVRANLPNPEGRLAPGLFMVARITLAERPEAILIPEEAVFAEGRASYVYRIRNDRAERVAVTLGQRRIGEVEVLAGLEAGDAVVTAGLQRLRPGVPVQIRGAAAGPVTSRADDAAGVPG
jgi:membrane fusion protein (multidrug efflux system)